MKKLVLMAAIAGLSLTLLFAQTDSTNSSRDPLDTLREKRAQLNNPQSVTQSKIFLLQQKEFETKAEAAKARAEEASNRAKAAKNKAAEPPTATEKANRPAYDQRRLELAAEQAEAEAEAAQAEADASQAQVDALKAKVEVSKAKADEVRTSPYRRAQSKYYDAQWQEQLEKKTLDEQAAASKDAAQKARIAADSLKRAKLARDTARKNAMALAAKNSGVPAVKQEAKSTSDEEMARRAHELEVAQAKAEKEAAAASDRAKKKEAAAAAAAAKETARKEKEAAKKTDLEKSAAAAKEAEAAKQAEAAKKADEVARKADQAAKEAEAAKQADAAQKAKEASKKAEAAAKKAEEARQAEAEVEAARKQQVEEARRVALANDEARKAESQVEAIRKQKEEAARQASALEKQMQEKQAHEARDKQAREAKASAAAAAAAAKKKNEKPALVSLRSQLPVDPSEIENDVQGKAIEALRRKQAELDLLDSQKADGVSGKKIVAKNSEPVKASEPVVATPAPKVAVSEVDNSAQAKALEALRKKQAELDAQEAQARSTALSAKERAKSSGETKQQQLAATKAAKAAEAARAARAEQEAAEAKAEEAAKAAQAAKAAAQAAKTSKPAVAETAKAAKVKPAPVVAEAPSKPATKADELDAALTKKAEPVAAPVVKIDTAAVDAETQKLESLRQRQADLRAQQVKIKTDLQNAVRNASEKKGKSDEALELIVDNPAARPTGTWMNGKTRGYYGNDYLWKGKGTGANYVKFVPVIPVAGEYEVYEWHISGTNRASDTPHIISYSGGTQTILVNQQLNGSKWNLLGKFNFAQGSAGEIRITDGTSTAGQMIMADAVRFVAVGGGSATGVAAETNSKELEDLRKQQASLDAEMAKLKEEIAASDKHLAELKAGNEKVQIEAAEKEAVRKATSVKEPSDTTSATRVAVKADTTKSDTKKTDSKKQPAKTPAPALTPDETSALTPKEQKLADLLRRYKNDEITPHEYHQMRAKIIAEP